MAGELALSAKPHDYGDAQKIFCFAITPIFWNISPANQNRPGNAVGCKECSHVNGNKGLVFNRLSVYNH